MYYVIKKPSKMDEFIKVLDADTVVDVKSVSEAYAIYKANNPSFKTITVKTKKEKDGVSFVWQGTTHYLPYNYPSVVIPTVQQTYFKNVV